MSYTPVTYGEPPVTYGEPHTPLSSDTVEIELLVGDGASCTYVPLNQFATDVLTRVKLPTATRGNVTVCNDAGEVVAVVVPYSLQSKGWQFASQLHVVFA